MARLSGPAPPGQEGGRCPACGNHRDGDRRRRGLCAGGLRIPVPGRLDGDRRGRQDRPALLGGGGRTPPGRSRLGLRRLPDPGRRQCPAAPPRRAHPPPPPPPHPPPPSPPSPPPPP